jgi:hypothetical protein
MKVVYYEDLENYTESCNSHNIEKLKTFNFSSSFGVRLNMNNEISIHQIDRKGNIKYEKGDFYIFDVSTISIPNVANMIERIVREGSLVLLTYNYLESTLTGDNIPFYLDNCSLTLEEIEEYEKEHYHEFSWTNNRDYDWIERKLGDRFEWCKYGNIIRKFSEIEDKLKAYNLMGDVK